MKYYVTGYQDSPLAKEKKPVSMPGKRLGYHGAAPAKKKKPGPALAKQKTRVGYQARPPANKKTGFKLS